MKSFKGNNRFYGIRAIEYFTLHFFSNLSQSSTVLIHLFIPILVGSNIFPCIIMTDKNTTTNKDAKEKPIASTNIRSYVPITHDLEELTITHGEIFLNPAI